MEALTRNRLRPGVTAPAAKTTSLFRICGRIRLIRPRADAEVDDHES